jgi:hypothetical protein
MANGVVYITARAMQDGLGKVCTYVKVLAEGIVCRKCGLGEKSEMQPLRRERVTRTKRWWWTTREEVDVAA